MMADNPNYWWSLNRSSSSLPLNTSDNHNQDLPLPWSQLLLVASDDRVKQETNFFRQSSHHNQQVMYNTTTTIGHGDDDDNDNDKVEGGGRRPCWMMPVLVSSMSPIYSYRRRSSSNNTSLSTSSSSTNNIYLDFSTNQLHNQHPILDHHSSISHPQCSDTSATSGVSKKARVQPSSTQHPPLKVRKEKLGDRITALHQLVSPFGKTDTASVLLEAIGYIRFLEAQIQALSSPYLGNVSSGNMRIQQSATDSPPKDLRSRGLRLVPVDCAHHINTTNGSDININVPDYWASSGCDAGGF